VQDGVLEASPVFAAIPSDDRSLRKLFFISRKCGSADDLRFCLRETYSNENQLTIKGGAKTRHSEVINRCIRGLLELAFPSPFSEIETPDRISWLCGFESGVPYSRRNRPYRT
jgi:hypothetical protein